MSKIPVRKASSARFDLPAPIAREIGKIITTWSFVEYLLQRLIWELAGVDEAVGRLAVREPRVTDRFGLVCDLALLRGIKIPQEPNKLLRRALDGNSRSRDLLAHGVWTYDAEAGWMVIHARGSYDFEPIGHSKNRRVDPEGLRASPDSLRAIRENIERTVESVRNLRKFIKAELGSSGDKSPSPPSPEIYPRDQS